MSYKTWRQRLADFWWCQLWFSIVMSRLKTKHNLQNRPASARILLNHGSSADSCSSSRSVRISSQPEPRRVNAIGAGWCIGRNLAIFPKESIMTCVVFIMTFLPVIFVLNDFGLLGLNHLIKIYINLPEISKVSVVSRHPFWKILSQIGKLTGFDERHILDLLGGVFKYVLCSPEPWERFPFCWAYFSDGLVRPPTSLCLMYAFHPGWHRGWYFFRWIETTKLRDIFRVEFV